MEIASIDPYKFYSNRSIDLLERALGSLQKQHEQGSDSTTTSSALSRGNDRGKGRLRQASYYSDDEISDKSDDDDDDDGGGDDDDADDRNDGVRVKNDDTNQNKIENAEKDTSNETEIQNTDSSSSPTTTTTDTSTTSSNSSSTNTYTSSKKKKKKTVEEYQKQMGTPPSETLITEVQNDHENHTLQKAYALSIPSVFFPSVNESLAEERNERNKQFYQSREELEQSQDHLEPILSLYHLATDLSSKSSSSAKQNILLEIFLPY